MGFWGKVGTFLKPVGIAAGEAGLQSVVNSNPIAGVVIGAVLQAKDGKIPNEVIAQANRLLLPYNLQLVPRIQG